ncbi:hypothetical protein [Priestia megaterium]|uniref:hypothetical protein n=1 Tax=Priestia megaterium TaxID=1404 RepID=UPI0032D999E9
MEKRQEMLKGLQGKVEELQTAKESVKNFVETMEAIKAEGDSAIKDLEKQIADTKEAQAMATDIGEAKLLNTQVKNLEEELQLTKGVVTAQGNKQKQELEQVVTELLKVYKACKFMFSAVDNEVTATASIRTFDKDIETMTDLGHQVDTGVAYAKAVLIKYGVITNSTSTYADVYLNSVGCHSKVNHVKSKLIALISDFRVNGIV